jgi:hypothetical protein
MKSKQIVYALAVLLIGLFAGCVTYPDYNQYFSLPIVKGDAEQGEKRFVEMRCIRCHTIKDLDLPAYEGDMPVKVELGGTILFAKSHANLTMSIVHPSDRLSERYLKQLSRDERRKAKSSPMHGEIPDMKISELIDLVAFLDSVYGEVPGYYRYNDWEDW